MEAVPGLQLVREDWNRQLGASWGPAARLIRRTGQLATGYPCTSDPECGCVHEIVEHGDGDFVSLCRCQPRECDPRPLQRDDVVVREVDVRQLAEDLALAMGIDLTFAEVEATPATWSVGTYSPMAGYRFPIILTVQTEEDDMEAVVSATALRSDRPFVLVAPTRDLFTSGCSAIMKRVGGLFVALSEDFDLDERGTVTSRRPVAEVMQPLLDLALPRAKAASAPQFPTPWDATWPEVNIRFRDGHSVSVRVREAHGVFTYTQMGMANARNGEPNKQWLLLHAFAERHGALDWSSPSAHRRNQKQKDTLAQRLRTFFGIEGDPFELTRASGGHGKGWKTRFALDP